MSLADRMRTTKFYHNLLFAKIEGKISQAELDRRTQERVSEQLSLGIGAATEPAGERMKSEGKMVRG